MKMRDLIQIVEKASLANHPDPRDNPQFRAWFGNSKVVDDNGRPMVLFHGTAADIRSFKGMIWGSVTPKLANEYAAMRSHYAKGGGNLMPVYMRIERPFDADLGLSKTVTIGEFFGAVMEQAAENDLVVTDALRADVDKLLTTVRSCARREESGPHYGRHDFWNEASMTFGRDGEAAIQRLFALFGFDGIRMMEGGELTYGAFSPEQVKSVFNRGQFDASSRNIDESRSASSDYRRYDEHDRDEIAEGVRAYHGTRSADLKFKMGHTGQNAHTFGDYTSTRYGAFFTDNPDFAKMYGVVDEYVLDIKNTANLEGRDGQRLYVEFVDTIDAFKQRDLWLAATNTHQTWQMFEGDLGKRFVAFLKRRGYDSATFEEYNDDDEGVEQKSQTIVVLNPRLIRRAA